MPATRDPLEERLTEERLSALLHFAEDAVLVIGRDGVIRRANELVTTIFGYRSDQLVGTHLDVLLPEASRASHARHVDAFSASGERQLRMDRRKPVHGRRRDGSAVPLAVSISTLDLGPCAHFVAVIRERLDPRPTHEAITWQHRHDRLTGLATRAAVAAYLSEHRSRHPSAPVAVIAMDIEDFGLVNDTLGVEIGDVVLGHVGERLASLAERIDGLAARLGSDEFVLAVPGIRPGPAVEAVALEIAVQVAAPVSTELGEVRVRLSLGARIWHEGETDVEHVLYDAGAALAQARSRRRRSLVVFDETTRAAQAARTRLAHDLYTGLRHGELWLAYQPQVETISGRPVAAEALVRWTHHQLGPISPSHFIGIAEENDELIGALSAFTVREACACIREWDARDVMPPGFQLAVNVSARQLRSPSLVEDVEDAIASSGIDPSMLCLEVTETAAMEDLDLGADLLRSLRDLGVSIALDDFGTGYSSLARLGSLPIDKIKLDGSLIRDIVHDLRSVAVVSALLSLSKVFGVTVVAECVETEEQRRVLEDLGCPLIQGWYFAPAEPAERFVEKMSIDSLTPADRCEPQPIGAGSRSSTR